MAAVTMKSLLKFAACLLLISGLSVAVVAQDKRNGRPGPQASPTVEIAKETPARTASAVKYTYEFTQPDFVVSHVVLEHDSSGRGKVTFVQRTETPIEEPIQISSAALTRILGFWRDLRFLDSNENYQAAKNFAHLGVYKVGMDDGQRRRTAEYNWSDNKAAWTLVNEYRRAADQAIWVFDMKLAREMQPLNAPSLLTELESRLTRNDLSDPLQLVPLLTELKTDEHIPLIARNHADRILKKIEKQP
jgi:hypothetical protein